MSQHDLPRKHREWRKGNKDDLPNVVNSKQLEDWIKKYHKCRNCHKVIRTYDQLNSLCEGVK